MQVKTFVETDQVTVEIKNRYGEELARVTLTHHLTESPKLYVQASELVSEVIAPDRSQKPVESECGPQSCFECTPVLGIPVPYTSECQKKGHNTANYDYRQINADKVDETIVLYDSEKEQS